METLIGFITGLGVLAILAVVFAESGLLIGFFLPGDSLLFTSGLLVQQGVLDINIHVFVVLLWAAAALGDNAGYLFGKKVGHRIFTRKDSLLFHHDNIVRAEQFYEKYGSKTIVLARFVPVIRTFAPIVAGVGSMEYRTFLAYNLLGAVLWAGGITYLGYYVGAWFESIGVNIDHFILPIIALIIALSLAPPAYHLLREPENRERLKKQWQKLIRR